MTEETEEQIFEGEHPSRMPGFVVMDLGMTAPDVCLSGTRRGAKIERPRKSSEIFVRAQTKTLKWLNDRSWEEKSWEEKREKAQVVRQRLSDAWERMLEYGSKAQDEYWDWIAGCLREPRNRHTGTEASLHLDQWTDLWNEANEEFRRKSRYVGRLHESIDDFNELAGRYCEFRRHVIAVEKKRGYSSRSAGSEAQGTEDRSLVEEYDPSPKVTRIMNAVMEIISDWGGLDGYENRAEVWKEVYRMTEDGDLEGSEAANNISESLRGHMYKNGFKDEFPETVEEIEQLARKICRD
jgi:hypothetical protein